MTLVLVAEDDPEINNLMALTLRMEEYEVLQAHDGHQALTLIETRSPDLVLLDVLMPGLNGYDVARELQGKPGTAHLPIIFVTAKQDMEDRVQGLEMAVDYICKPFAVPELLARVRTAVRVRRLQEQLEKMAVTDELTGLTNRRGFMSQFEDELWRAKRFNHPITVLLFDLDHFKRINDTWGHAQGDLVLKEFSRVLEHSSRRIDKVARFGGEEFAAVLPETEQSGAQIFAEKVRAATEALELYCEDERVPVTVSIGATTADVAHIHADSNEGGDGEVTSLANRLLQEADRCLYEAKESGRNRVVVCSFDGAATSS
jgi:diguanylate cyclase (GGDEF)-like protein